MRKLGQYTHPDLAGKTPAKIYKRISTRAIVVKRDLILLIYTKRYDDYSLPGGGVDSDEHIEASLIRELMEETGAKDIKIIRPYGVFEEIRPIHYPEFDAMHQLSYVYICDVHESLGETNLESYEIANGSRPVWVPLKEALEHNQRIIKESPTSMGLSIERETYLLNLIKEEFFTCP